MIQRICFFVHENQYDSKRTFTKGLAKAFEARGVETLTLAPEGGAMNREHGQALQDFAPDLTCSFNCIQPLPNGSYLWDLLKTPHLFINLDSAIYILKFCQSPYIQISCVDHLEVDLLRQTGFKRGFFLPHAISGELQWDPKAERPYDVILLGSCYDHEALRRQWKSRLSPELNHAVDNAIDITLSDNRSNFIEGVMRALAIQEIDPKTVDTTELFTLVDYFCRGKDRLELVQSIREVPVHIFGEVHKQTDYDSGGWAHYLSKQKNIVLHPPVSYEEGLCLLAQSKFCLNSCPSFKQGSHERVFAGLALGALPLSNDTLFWREEFRDQESILLYPPKRWEKANELICKYLDREEDRQAMVSKGREVVMSKHTWDQRVDQLLARLPGLIGVGG